MATTRDFVPRVQSFARLCPVPIVKDEVLRALTEFCRKSGIWKHSSINDIVAGVDLYTPTVPIGAAVGVLESVAVCGTPLCPWANDWPTDGASSPRPMYYMLDHTRSLRLYPMPDQDGPGKLIVNMALETAHDAATVPDFLYQHHREAIVSGAIGGVLSMVGQPWANPQLALYHIKNFKSEIAKIRISVLKSGTLGTLTITASPL